MKTSEWRDYFEDRGLEKDLIEIYVQYAARLIRKKIPVIFEFDHLSLLLGINRKYLAKMIARPDDFYRKFEIPKRSGGKRKIFAPYESLLSCQRWILQNILYKIPVHYNAHGFVPGASIKSNAQAHIGSAALLKMDLQDFFPSIPQAWIIQLFLSLGYARNVAYYLSALCCYEERLAQGAATSPTLSNIIFRSLDNRLTKLSDKAKLKYSRYADDMTFSGDYIHSSFPAQVKGIVTEYGLTINDDKTRLKTQHGSRIITGISIANGTLSAPRAFKRSLRNDIHFIEKFGILSHMSHKRMINPNYLQSLLGKVSFWLYLEPNNPEARRAHFFVSGLINSGKKEKGNGD